MNGWTLEVHGTKLHYVTKKAAQQAKAMFGGEIVKRTETHAEVVDRFKGVK